LLPLSPRPFYLESLDTWKLQNLLEHTVEGVQKQDLVRAGYVIMEDELPSGPPVLSVASLPPVPEVLVLD
jgi:hypothetical protein